MRKFFTELLVWMAEDPFDFCVTTAVIAITSLFALSAVAVVVRFAFLAFAN